MQRLTSKSEELENRINRIVSDGTTRIGDLEFRLVELEGGDVSDPWGDDDLGWRGSDRCGRAADRHRPRRPTRHPSPWVKQADFRAGAGGARFW